MMYGSRISRLEMEALSLRASVNHLLEIVNNLMVAQVDHPEYEVQARNALAAVRGKGYRIARDRKALVEAQDLQDKLRTMAEDYSAVAEMLAKDKHK